MDADRVARFRDGGGSAAGDALRALSSVAEAGLALGAVPRGAGGGQDDVHRDQGDVHRDDRRRNDENRDNVHGDDNVHRNDENRNDERQDVRRDDERRNGERQDDERPVDERPVDVRCEPLAVRDGCAPDRIPAGRWVSDRALVRSEQFAVNEALAELRAAPGVFAVHAPAGTGVTEVFSDLVAALVTERARRLADLPDPAAAFGQRYPLGTHTVAVPVAALTGYEIMLAGPDGAVGGLAEVGQRWRERAAEASYFPATAWLADDEGGWALLLARLGDRQANRAFADRWWHGALRGTDVLFPAGEPMPAALTRLREERRDGDWPAAVARFRAALAKAEKLSAERMRVSAALTRLSSVEQACEEASASAEASAAELAELTAREPSAATAVAAAEEHRRCCLADLAEHELARPATLTITDSGKAALRDHWLPVAVAGGLRRGRNWRDWAATRRALRAACADATQSRDAAAREVEALRARLAAARTARDRAAAEVTRLAAEMGPLAETVGRARQRWGDFVPDGPSQAETEDTALIERRETSAPWADRAYAMARAEVFLAALGLHKALIAAQAEVFEGNLAALVDLLTGDAGTPAGDAGTPTGEPETPTGVTGPRGADTGGGTSGAGEPAVREAPGVLAAWQSLFLVIPVAAVPFEEAGSLFAGLGDGSFGWLLAEATQLTGPHVHAALRVAGRAVLAGDATLGGAVERAGQNSRYGTWLGAAAGDGGGRTWVGAPLRVVRGQDRAVIDLRNDLSYDGLLVPDRG